MTDPHDGKAALRWQRLNHTFLAYQDHRSRKEDSPYALSYIDLLFVSNFKGGNASIGDAHHQVNACLRQHYQPALERIAERFGDLMLVDVKDADRLPELTEQGQAFLDLTQTAGSCISGFGISWASALLALNFPDLFPILDRRVLNGLGLLRSGDLNDAKQVKDRISFYPQLIERMAERAASGGGSLRKLDEALFKVPMPKMQSSPG